MDHLLHGFMFGLGFAFASILVLAVSCGGLTGKRDATDSPTKRSGFVVLTDHGTGREYLMAPSGALTPRLAKADAPSKDAA